MRADFGYPLGVIRPERVSPRPLSGLAELLGVGKTTDIIPNGPGRLSGVTLDSRQVRAGDLYAALPGEHTHGAAFCDQAVAAKTGTSQESGPNCSLCQYGSSFIGMAPGNDPQVVVSVNVQDPKKNGYFGAVVAGPVFYSVMKFALQTLGIPPQPGLEAPYVRLNAR